MVLRSLWPEVGLSKRLVSVLQGLCPVWQVNAVLENIGKKFHGAAAEVSLPSFATEISEVSYDDVIKM